jgi:psp operon transcriptional activator
MVLAKQRTAGKNPVKTSEGLGQSEKFIEFQELLAKVAPINRPVLLLGERGTGKELAASRLHYLSKRWQGPFIALNCSALNPTLIESELFGYEKGAFTGANQRRSGRFEAADGGTLFLDEIGTIPMEVQEKILRVVEYGQFERVGDSAAIEVDVRIIAATNADLIRMVSLGKFKRDLLDRLSFEVLFLPPLRERKEDIMLLANHFASRMAYELERQGIPRFSLEAIKALENYDWPGNVRELKNLVERAVYRSSSAVISDINFDPFCSPYESVECDDEEEVEEPIKKGPALSLFSDKTLTDAVNELQIQMINNALKSAKHNQKIAAKKLGITYHQFRGLYRKLHQNID